MVRLSMLEKAHFILIKHSYKWQKHLPSSFLENTFLRISLLKIYSKKIETCNIIKQETPSQVFSCKFSENFQNAVFFYNTSSGCYLNSINSMRQYKVLHNHTCHIFLILGVPVIYWLHGICYGMLKTLKKLDLIFATQIKYDKGIQSSEKNIPDQYLTT